MDYGSEDIESTRNESTDLGGPVRQVQTYNLSSGNEHENLKQGVAGDKIVTCCRWSTLYHLALH